MMRRDHRVVEQQVIVVGTAYAGAIGQAMPGGNVAMPVQNLDPDHFCHRISPRKRRASASAFGQLTPRTVMCEISASRPRSWVTDFMLTSYRPAKSRYARAH